MIKRECGWYNSLSNYFRQKYKERLFKIPLSLPLTCPNRDGTKGRGGCIYCGPSGSGTGDIRPVETQLDDGIKRGKRAGFSFFMAYFQAYSNTYASLDFLKKEWSVVLKFPEIVAISVGTRPDCVDKERLELLSSFSDKREVWIEYGLQSMHNRTLNLIERGHTKEDFERAVLQTKEYPLKICVHLILGLLGESLKDMIETARWVSSLPVHGVKLHCLYVEKGSKLEKIYNSSSVKLMTRREYAETAVQVMENLREDIIMHRIVSDCPKDKLIAPEWLLDKNASIAEIRSVFKIRNSYQGCAV